MLDVSPGLLWCSDGTLILSREDGLQRVALTKLSSAFEGMCLQSGTRVSGRW